MTLPVIGQQDAAQIRMIVKDDAKQIKGFAFVPIGRAPNTGNGGHVRVVFVQQHLQTNAMKFRCGKQVIIDLEARFLFGSTIEAANVRQEIEFQARRGLQKGAGRHDVFAGNDDRSFAQRFGYGPDPFRMFTL